MLNTIYKVKVIFRANWMLKESVQSFWKYGHLPASTCIWTSNRILPQSFSAITGGNIYIVYVSHWSALAHASYVSHWSRLGPSLVFWLTASRRAVGCTLHTLSIQCITESLKPKALIHSLTLCQFRVVLVCSYCREKGGYTRVRSPICHRAMLLLIIIFLIIIIMIIMMINYSLWFYHKIRTIFISLINCFLTKGFIPSLWWIWLYMKKQRWLLWECVTFPQGNTASFSGPLV